MQEAAVNSIGTLTGSDRPERRIVTLETRAKRQLGHVASRLFSSGPFGELVVVSLISIFVLRGSG